MTDPVQQPPLWRRYLRFLGNDPARDVDDELDFHLTMRVADLMRTGLTEVEAQTQAAREFGDAARVRAELHDIGRSRAKRERRSRATGSMIFDLRLALRGVVRAPMVFGLAILSLGLGVAVNTTMFSALDAFLLRPLPYESPEELVLLRLRDFSQGGERLDPSFADYQNFKARSQTVELAAYVSASMNVSSTEEPVRLRGVRISQNFPELMGARPILGRAFTAAEFREGSDNVVMISESLWQRRFAGDERALGTVLLLDNRAHTVIGVLPNQFRFPDPRTDLYTPLVPKAAELGERSVGIVGRLRAQGTIDAADQEFSAISEALATEYPETNNEVGAQLLPLDRALFNSSFRDGAAICIVAGLFVLLIACSNVANLLLARAAGRQRELAVCVALGATRSRLVGRLMAESLLVAIAGGALGALLAFWGVKGFSAMLPADIPMVDRMALNGRALLFTSAVSIASAVLFGLAPAWQTANHGIRSAMGAPGALGAVGAGRPSRLRSTLVTAQISLSVVLLIGAGLLVKGYTRATRDLGFGSQNVVTMRVHLPEATYPGTPQMLAFFAQVEETLAAVPGVEGVALSDALPTSPYGESVRYGAQALTGGDERPSAEVRSINASFMDVLQIGQREGRELLDQDGAEGGRVAAVNETLASRHWQGNSPVGDRISFEGESWEVVGVVGDVKEWGAGDPAPPMLYVPLAQRPARSIGIAVRSDLPLETLVPQLRDAIRALDSSLPLFEVATMDQVIRNSQQRDAMMVQSLGIFSGIAVVLAMLGVYGVMAYVVSQRTPEVGVRVAVGARSRDVLRLIVGEGALIAGAGVVLGLITALGVSRFLSGFLNGISPFDAPTFLIVSSLVFAVAIIATYFPARRAAMIDPLTALRKE